MNRDFMLVCSQKVQNSCTDSSCIHLWWQTRSSWNKGIQCSSPQDWLYMAQSQGIFASESPPWCDTCTCITDWILFWQDVTIDVPPIEEGATCKARDQMDDEDTGHNLKDNQNGKYTTGGSGQSSNVCSQHVKLDFHRRVCRAVLCCATTDLDWNVCLAATIII